MKALILIMMIPLSLGETVMAKNKAYASLQQKILVLHPWLDKTYVKNVVVISSKASINHNLPIELILSIIAVESNFDATVVGTKGELGLMQQRPEYFSEISIDSATAYLRHIQWKVGHEYPDYRWVEFYNRGLHAKAPKRFVYYNKVMKAFKYFGGNNESRAIQQDQKGRESSRRNRSLAEAI